MVERVNVERLASIRYGPHRTLAIRIEVRLPHHRKDPTRALELTLPGRVMLVLFSPVPLIAVAFDGQSSIDAIEDQVDAFPGCLDLRPDRVLPSQKLQSDINLEPALIGLPSGWLPLRR